MLLICPYPHPDSVSLRARKHFQQGIGQKLSPLSRSQTDPWQGSENGLDHDSTSESRNGRDGQPSVLSVHTRDHSTLNSGPMTHALSVSITSCKVGFMMSKVIQVLGCRSCGLGQSLTWRITGTGAFPSGVGGHLYLWGQKATPGCVALSKPSRPPFFFSEGGLMTVYVPRVQ